MAQQNLGEGTEFVVFKHFSFHSLTQLTGPGPAHVPCVTTEHGALCSRDGLDCISTIFMT